MQVQSNTSLTYEDPERHDEDCIRQAESLLKMFGQQAISTANEALSLGGTGQLRRSDNMPLQYRPLRTNLQNKTDLHQSLDQVEMNTSNFRSIDAINKASRGPVKDRSDGESLEL